MRTYLKSLPARSAWTVAIVVAVYLVAVLNVGFWTRLYSSVAPSNPGGWLLLAACAGILVCAYLIVLMSVAHPLLFKPVVAGALIFSAPLAYFGQEYGLGVSATLLHTAMETNRAEFIDLLTWKLAVFVVGLGLLPAFLVVHHPISWPDWGQRVRTNAIAVTVLAAGCAGLIGLNYGSLASVLRSDRALHGLVVPYGAVSAAAGLAFKSTIPPQTAIAPLGTDARRGTAPRGKPALTVLVIGETARADHFSINGYKRPTSPRLAAVESLVNFPNATSCATLTADSLPCIFSGVGRAGNVTNIAYTRENLVDVLRHAGFDVAWYDNQAGCKGVCARIPTQNLSETTDARFCWEGECHDEILVDAVRQRLTRLERDTVLVLHTMGSHGPAYWKRYPTAFERFTPACKTSQFSKCTREEIVAAYDNTIAYTDHVLGEMISVLEAAAQAGHATSMLYVSDHGESLGEGNVYLHGVPFLFAPRAQTHVPMVAWLSDEFRRWQHLGRDCLAKRSTEPVSHDHIFHTVLGLLDVRSRVKNDALDLTASCRD